MNYNLTINYSLFLDLDSVGAADKATYTMYEYHVTFSGSKKLIKAEKKEGVLQSIRKVFNISTETQIVVQKFDKEWDDFVDINADDDEDLPDKGRLHVVTVIEAYPITPITIDALVDMQDLTDPAATSQCVSPVNAEPSPVHAEASMCEPSSVHAESSKCQPSPVHAESSGGIPIPLNYKLPSDGIPLGVRRNLLEKIRLGSKQRSELMQALYDDITTRYAFYLDTSEYDILARSLLRDYPYLSDGLTHRDAVASWHRKVKDKFKNSRKRADRAQPEVKKRLVTYPHGAGNEKATKNVWGLINFLPSRSPADNDATIEVFTKELQMQSKLKEEKRDSEKIKRRMDSTFADRRQAIVVKALPLKSIKETYPLLCSEREISREFFRLAGIKLTVFNEGVEKFAGRIVMVKTKNKLPDLTDKLKKRSQESETEAAKNDAVNMQAVVTVPALLNEKLQTILKQHEDDECATPYVLATDPLSGAFSIVADGEEVCSTTSLLKAFRLLLATFYVFNYVYPKNAVSTLTFFQKVFLNLQDEAKKCTKVINLMSKIIVSAKEKKED